MTDFSAKWFDRKGRSKKSASLHHAYYRPGKSSADFTLCKFAPRAYLPNFYAFLRKFAVRWGSDPLLAPAPKFCTPPPRRLFLLQVDHRRFRKSAQRFYEGFFSVASRPSAITNALQFRTQGLFDYLRRGFSKSRAVESKR